MNLEPPSKRTKTMNLFKSRAYMSAIGTLALVAGTLVYVIDRQPGETYFVFTFIPFLSAHDISPSLFGSIGDSLPAFVHPFSFALITAGLCAETMRGCLASSLA